MSYAGNPALAPEVRSRIVETFRHTLDVAARGSLEEARLGCDFILQLDPLFAPAQTLSDRLRAAAGPVSVEDLVQRFDGDGAAAAGAAAPAAGSAATGSPATVSPDLGLRDELARLVAARDFAGLNRRAQQAQAAIAADPSLQGLLASAQELAEAAPYVDRFLDQARTALAHGRPGDARAALDKARALDPDHPSLAALLEHATGSPVGGSAVGGAATFAAATEVPAPAQIDLSDSLSAGEVPLDLEPIDLPGLGGSGPSDPDPRVAELLDEGQGLYERGELQSAIDAWSRVFLIDIDHQEAARRIDVARNAKAEQERRLEEVFHEAL